MSASLKRTKKWIMYFSSNKTFEIYYNSAYIRIGKILKTLNKFVTGCILAYLGVLRAIAGSGSLQS